MSIFVSVCVYRRILPTAKPILFSFTVYLLISPGKVYNHPPKKKIAP